MERREFLKAAFGAAIGAAVVTVAAKAAPLSPPNLGDDIRRAKDDLEPALADQHDLDEAKVEQVRWGRRRWGYRRRWGWRRRRFWGYRRWHRRRVWGYRRRHWRRRYWRRRYW